MSPPILAIDRSDPAADGSRWASMRTALPAEWLRRYWLAFTVGAELSACASLAVILIILLRPNLRSQAFNQLIIALAVPDFVFSFCCGWTCLSHYLAGHWHGGSVICTIQGVYISVGVGASMWMNVLVARELQRLASSLASVSVYRPPSASKLWLRVACVYATVVAVSLMPEVPWLPIAYGAHRGLICVPMEYNRDSTLYLWLCFMSSAFVFPIAAILFYFKRVYDSLFRGSAEVCAADRAIFAFFLRLLLVFLIMWTPVAVLVWIVLWDAPISQHLAFYGAMWSHLQGLVSAYFYLRKSDIWVEVVRLAAASAAVVKTLRPWADGFRLPTFAPQGGGASRRRQGAALAKTRIEQLSAEVMAALCQKEQAEMRVIELGTWLRFGRFARSSDGVTRLLREGDVVVFVSHRWWAQDCPDDSAGSKYCKISRGVLSLASRHRLDHGRVVLWCDWACIEQDDAGLQARGIASLITYAARSSFVLIPVASDPVCARAFRDASHPMMLPNYGERAWCRLEVYIFMCVSEIRQRPPYCYGYGPAGGRGSCWPARDCLRPLMRSFAKGAAFDCARLPSTGDLTCESDRDIIRDIEKTMHDVYVRTIVLAEKLRLEAMSLLHVCSLQEKQIRCEDVPLLASEIFCGDLAPRIVELRLDGSLLAAEGVAEIMHSIVCAKGTCNLAVLALSNNPFLGLGAIQHIAACLTDPFFTLTELRLSRCALRGEAVEPLVVNLPNCTALRHLDLSHNELEDASCERLLEACGGCDRPAVLLDLDGNPLTAPVVLKAARARIAVELGHRSAAGAATGASPLHSGASSPAPLADGGWPQLSEGTGSEDAIYRARV